MLKNRMIAKALSIDYPTIARAAKYLGGLFTLTLSTAKEITARIKAMGAAWSLT